MSKEIPTDEYLIRSFLLEIKTRSTGAFENNKSVLRKFFKHVKIPIKDIRTLDIRNYLINVIDKSPIKLNTKESIRYMLSSFFNYVGGVYLDYGIEYTNPVPSKKLYKYTTQMGDIKRYSKRRLKVLTIEQVDRVLNYVFRYRSLRDFVMIGLATCTGARISEIRTILVDDLHLYEGFFETGFMIDARKTTLTKGEGLLFFFPYGFQQYIETYLDEYECSRYLFPGKYQDRPLSHEATGRICREIRMGCHIYWSWHYFRRTIITERMKMKCPLWISEGLMNHAPSSVEGENYIKLKIEEKRELYDEFFPYKEIKFYT